MRANFSPVLLRRLRSNPPSVHVIAEAVIAQNDGEASDVRQRQEQWETADGPPSTADFEFLEDGGLALAATNATILDNATGATFQQDIDGRNAFEASGDFHCAKVVWGGTAEDNDVEIRDVRWYLNPDPLTTGALVRWWELHLFVGTSLSGDAGSAITLTEIGVKRVLAPQVAGDVTFDFTDRPRRPKPKQFGSAMLGGTWMYCVLYALDENGLYAANVAFAKDAGTPSLTTAGNVLTGVKLTAYGANGWVVETDDAELPRIRIRTGTFVAATITFSDIDVGTAPSIVQFMGQGETPGATSITYSASDDAGANWYPYTDGDFAATDLPSVAVQQTYHLRATLTPGPLGSSTPILRKIGAEWLTQKLFDNLATVTGDQGQVDPPTLESRIGQIRIKAATDGQRGDFASAIENLFAENFIGQIEWRIWIGAVDDNDRDAAARHQLRDGTPWGLINTFLTLDYEVVDGGIEVIAVDPMSLQRAKFPIYDTIAGTRETYVATEELIKDVYDEIFDLIGYPDRYRGPGIPDTTTRVSKEVSDSDVMTEQQALGAVIGYAQIGTQGRTKAVNLFGDQTPIATIVRDDIKYGPVSPGFRNRIPEFFVPYDYDAASGSFLRETRAFHDAAILKLTRTYLDAPTVLESETAQWVRSLGITSLTRVGTTVTATFDNDHGLSDGEDLTVLGANETEYNITAAVTVTASDVVTYELVGAPATPATGTITAAVLPHRIAKRVVQAFGPGLMLVSFKLNYPHPEAEIGDALTLEMDRLVVRDPTATNRQIRGLVRARVIIVEILDMVGQEMIGLVPSYSSIVSSTAKVDRDGIAWHGRLKSTIGGVLPAGGTTAQTFLAGSSDVRFRCRLYKLASQNITTATPTAVAWTTEEYDHGDLHDNAVDPERITIPAGGNVGTWIFTATVTWGVGTTGIRQLRIQDSIGRIASVSMAAHAGNPQQSVSVAVDSPDVGEYYRVYVEHDEGSNVAIVGILAEQSTFMATHIW